MSAGGKGAVGRMTDVMPTGAAQTESAEKLLKVFISYRKADTSSAARLLYKSLTPILGKENLFFDVESLRPGMNWRQAIKASANSAGVLLAVIGPRWLEALQARSKQAAVGPDDDVLRQEIVYSLTNLVDVGVIPVLVEGAQMPDRDQLPSEIRALADIQARTLGDDDTYDDDVNRLVDRIREIAADPAARGAKPAREPVPISDKHPERYRTVAQQIVGREHVVLVLGSEATDSLIRLPDSHRLAAELAKEHGYPVPAPPSRLDLAEVAQYVAVVKGPDLLYRSLRERLSVESDVGEIHRVLASLPGLTEQLGYPRQHQLIVTTSYDTLLEQAFRDIGEPFDLAVYVASGSDKGRFVHVPGGSGPAKRAWPGNQYTDFPFDHNSDLTRSLIVKIYGAVDTRDGWQDNFVVTEDNYIEYLSGAGIEELVPTQILARLRASQCLFLGYDIREWSLRVFLKRVWDAPIRNRSWVVQESPDELEERLWLRAGAGMVTLYDEPVEKYIAGLEACLTQP
jgi:hypothetical protein